MELDPALELVGDLLRVFDEPIRAREARVNTHHSADELITRVFFRKLRVLRDRFFPQLRPEPLRRLDRKDPAQPRLLQHFSFHFQCTGYSVRRLQDVTKTGEPGSDHHSARQPKRGGDHRMIQPVLHPRPPKIP